MSRAQWQFHKGNERQRKETAVVAHEVDLETRRDAIEARPPFNEPKLTVVRFAPLVRRPDQLEVEVVEQADLEIHRSDLKGGNLHFPAFRVGPIVSHVRKVHLNLEVARVHRKRAIRFVGPIRAQVAHQLRGGWIEKIVTRFIRNL